jgi:hypothetical protein
MDAKRLSNANEPSAAWPTSRRRIVSALLVFHLAAVIFAPLSLNDAFSSLFRPFQFLRVYATTLYLDNGYRFFAPDPGPTHTIRIEHGPAGGALKSERVPDAKQTWPRLLYHRWFMLGESLAHEVSGTLASYNEFTQTQQQTRLEEAALRQAGRLREANQLRVMRDDNQRDFDRHWAMTLSLCQAIKNHFVQRYPNESIQIFSRRQLIPQPFDILIGKSIAHPDFVQEIDLTNPQASLNAAKPEELAPPEESIR